MKKYIKEQWHIAIIVLAVFVVSALTWKTFFQNSCREAIAGAMQGRFSAIDSLWNDSIYKRGQMSAVDIIATYYGTGDVLSEQVLLGNDNWLFYKTTADGDPIADFEGTNYFSTQEMDDILQKALRVQNTLEKRGIQFEIFIPPNKENVYTEHMPLTYTHCEKSRTDIIIQYLKENNVNIVSPKDVLLKRHLEMQLYYSGDSHWNYLGAYIGTTEALAAWNLHIPDISERTISTSPSRSYGDLAQMIHMGKIFSDRTECKIDSIYPEDCFSEEKSDTSLIHYSNHAISDKRTLLLVGDSFRTCMRPVVKEAFSDVYIVHRDDYTPGLIDKVQPDYVMAEYVERYADRLSNIEFLLLE